MNQLTEIQALLQELADCRARLNLLPYDGSPEIKNNGSKKYLYVHKRIGSRVVSTYVGIYSDELYQLLVKSAKEGRELRRQVRRLSRKLADLGYTESVLAPKVVENLDFARANMKANIYDQAVLEGVATSFPQTEEILDNGRVSGMTVSDIQKILNLKHAWEFILDENVIRAESDYYLLSHIAKLVNEGFFAEGGRIRGVPVTIGGTSYVPPIPLEYKVKEEIEGILKKSSSDLDKAIELLLYCMKTQIFLDGNKRAAVIYANHYLIARGKGCLVIPEKLVPEFKELLIEYYEGRSVGKIKAFLKKECLRKF